MPLSQVIEPAQQSQVSSKGQQQQSRGDPTSYLFIDDQQAGSSRPHTHHSHFHQLTCQHQSPLLQPPHIKSISSLQPSPCLLRTQPMPNSSRSRTFANHSIDPFQDNCCKLFQGPFQDHPNLPKTINKLLFLTKPKQETLHRPTQNTFVPNKNMNK